MLYACRTTVATVYSLVEAARSIAPRVEVCEARPDDGVHDDVARQQCVDALQEVGVGCSARTRIHTAHKYALLRRRRLWHGCTSEAMAQLTILHCITEG